MFGFLKKNKAKPILDMVNLIGVRSAADMFAAQISHMLPTSKVALQFLLEELEAASMGNAEARRFVQESGIAPNYYLGAMNDSMPEVEGPGGPQQLLLLASLELKSDEDLMVEFRTSVVDNLMRHFRFGRYGLPSVGSESNISEREIDTSGAWLSSGDELADRHFQEGVTLIDEGRFVDAIAPLELAAEGGSVSAIQNLGMLYRNGLADSLDIDRAVELFKKAMDSGHPRAAAHYDSLTNLDFPKFTLDNMDAVAARFDPLHGGDGAFVSALSQQIWKEINAAPASSLNMLSVWAWYESNRLNEIEDGVGDDLMRHLGMELDNIESLDMPSVGAGGRAVSCRLDALFKRLTSDGYVLWVLTFTRCSIVGRVIQLSGVVPNKSQLWGVSRFAID